MNKLLFLICFFQLQFSFSQTFEKKKLAILSFENKSQNSLEEGFTNVSFMSDSTILALHDMFLEQIQLVIRESFIIISKEEISDLLDGDLEKCIGECKVQIGRDVGADYVLSTEITSNTEGGYSFLFSINDTRKKSFLHKTTLSIRNKKDFETQINTSHFELYKHLLSLNPKRKGNDPNITAVICKNINQNSVSCEEISFNTLHEIEELYPLECFNKWLKIEEDRYLPMMADLLLIKGPDSWSKIKQISRLRYKNYRKRVNKETKLANWDVNIDHSWEDSKWNSLSNRTIKDTLTSKDLQNVLFQYDSSINRCAIHILEADKIDVQIKLEGRTGNVIFVNILNENHQDTDLSICIKKEIKKWKFPKFKAESLIVNIPFAIDFAY